MLTKEVVVDKIEVLEDGHIQVRKAHRVLEDGKIIAKTYERYLLHPGESLSGREDKVVKIANTVWDKDTIKKYKDKIKEEYNGNTK